MQVHSATIVFNCEMSEVMFKSPPVERNEQSCVLIAELLVHTRQTERGAIHYVVKTLPDVLSFTVLYPSHYTSVQEFTPLKKYGLPSKRFEEPT